MPAAFVRNVFPVVTALAATLYLATAVQAEPSFDVDAAAAPVQAEVQHCVAGGRDADACLDEVDGKALIERADWLARSDAAGRRASR